MKMMKKLLYALHLCWKENDGKRKKSAPYASGKQLRKNKSEAEHLNELGAAKKKRSTRVAILPLVWRK